MPEERLAAMEKKIDAIYVSVEKTRKYHRWFVWLLVVSAVAMIIPVIGLVFAIPKFISTYSQSLDSLDLNGL